MRIDALATERIHPGERVLRRVDRSEPDACWVYRGTPSQVYGVLWDGQRRTNIYAHVAVWEFLNRQRLPKGMVVHHRCETKRCVNPEHLAAMPHPIHNALHHRSEDECRNGHPYSPETLHFTRSGGKLCRVCERAAWARYRAANREWTNAARRAKRRMNRAA